MTFKSSVCIVKKNLSFYTRVTSNLYIMRIRIINYLYRHTHGCTVHLHIFSGVYLSMKLHEHSTLLCESGMCHCC